MATTAQERSWQGVARAVQARMDELGWDQIDLARTAGVSDATVRKIQTAGAERYHRSTLLKISRALGWPADGIWQLLATGEAPEPSAPAPGTVDDDESLDDLLEDVSELRLRLGDLEAKLRREEQRRGLTAR